MTPDEILSITEQDEAYPNERYGEITVPLLGVAVELVVLTRKPDVAKSQSIVGRLTARLAPKRSADVVIPQSVADRLTALLALDPQDMPALAAALAKHCRAMTMEYLDTIDYPSHSLPSAEVCAINWKHYGLNEDGTPPDGWVNPEWLAHVTLMTDPAPSEAELAIGFIVPWEEEHGASVTVDARGEIQLL